MSTLNVHYVLYLNNITSSFSTTSSSFHSSLHPYCSCYGLLCTTDKHENNMKSYSFLLLMLATVFVSTACGCNFERIDRSPRYEDITQPKQILTVPRAHGICVASDGKFAVIPCNNNGNFYLFYSCGKLMKIVRIPFGHRSTLGDCTFSGNNLYIAGAHAKKIYKYSENGKFRKSLLPEKVYTTLPHVKVDFMLPHGVKTVEM